VGLIADTRFLIGLWRRQSWAAGYAARNSGKSMGIPWVVLGRSGQGMIPIRSGVFSRTGCLPPMPRR
jgi:hypothetical protein